MKASRLDLNAYLHRSRLTSSVLRKAGSFPASCIHSYFDLLGSLPYVKHIGAVQREACIDDYGYHINGIRK